MIDRDLLLKKEISNNIKKLLKKKDWTQLKLSEMSGISKSTLSDYTTSNTLISPGNVERLADVFRVLKHEIDPSFKSKLTSSERSTPFYTKDVTELEIVGSICCGNGTYAFEDIQGSKEIPNNWIKGAEHFLLRADGDSMINARIYPGDLLLIRKQEDFEQGEIMAVMIGDEAVLKKIYRTDGSIMLQSENPKYPPRFLNSESEIRIIGKLKMNLIEY